MDSCVLLDALALNFIGDPNNKMYKDNFINKVGQNKIEYLENYFDFLNNINCYITTSQIIGELQGLVGSRLNPKGKYKEKFWETSLNFLTSKKIDENLIKLVETFQYYKDDENLSIYYNIGYNDIGLIKLAIDNNNLRIISRDSSTLRVEAQKNGIRVFNPEDYFNSYNSLNELDDFLKFN